MDSGHDASHIRRMRVLYARRRAMLVELVQRHLGPDSLQAHASNAGLHLSLSLPEGVDEMVIAQAAQARGILSSGVQQDFLTDPSARRTIVTGHSTEAEFGLDHRLLCVALN